jgi:hypothetical protein
MYLETVIRKALAFWPDTCISWHGPFKFLDIAFRLVGS